MGLFGGKVKIKKQSAAFFTYLFKVNCGIVTKRHEKRPASNKIQNWRCAYGGFYELASDDLSLIFERIRTFSRRSIASYDSTFGAASAMKVHFQMAES